MGGDPGVQIERLIPAPIETVFAAWTEPGTMARWLSPVGRAEVEADPRIGGTFRVVMVGDGTRIEHTGQYLVYDPPDELSFTWSSHYTGPEVSVVKVSLSEEDGLTRLLLIHEGLPVDQVEGHRGGWGAMIDRLGGLFRPVHTDDGSPS